MTSRGLLDIRMEETMTLDFDLSSGSGYVDTGSIRGRMLVDFELNRSALIDRLDRIDSPSTSDKTNAFFEGWSLEDADTDTVELEYGQLLLRGAEPLGIDPAITLGDTFDVETLRSTSPNDLKRTLRTEQTYETTYEELAEEVSAYLKREGVIADPSFSAPVHLQAKADPAVEGTNFSIEITNNESWAIHTVTVAVDMPPEVGREVVLGHRASGDGGRIEESSGVSGSYDPEANAYEFTVEDGLARADTGGADREIRFHVPARAQRSLETVSGEARFARDQPFSSLIPVAVFDAGGRRLEGETVDVTPTGHVEATFETPTADITVSSVQEVRKEFRTEGVLPNNAVTTIEEVLRDRGVSGTDTQDPDENRDMREGKEVTRFSGGIKNGTVLVGDTRIEINVNVKGERRTANRETSRESDENLPAEQRSVATEYGWTGVTIRGKGTDQEIVDEYVTDLRDELQVSIKSLSEAM